MPSLRFSIALVVTTVIAPAVIRAQDASDSAAYRALTQTPLGALPPLFDVAVTGERAHEVSFRAQYGIMSYDTHEYIHNFAAGIDVPVGTMSLGLTVGYYWPDCNGICAGHVMTAANVSQNLISAPIGRGNGVGTFNVGIIGELGYAKPRDSTIASGQVTIPLSLVPQKQDARLVPYLAPGFGVGLVRGNSSTEAGIQFTFGAGLGIIASPRFTANVGVRRVFLSGGNWVVGVGATLGGERRRGVAGSVKNAGTQ